jgi:hypothetical protein
LNLCGVLQFPHIGITSTSRYPIEGEICKGKEITKRERKDVIL